MFVDAAINTAGTARDAYKSHKALIDFDKAVDTSLIALFDVEVLH